MSDLQLFDARRAIVDRLQLINGDDQPLAGVDVGYRMPPDVGLKAVYLGSTRFQRQEAVAEQGLAANETDNVEVRVRVRQSGDDVEAVENEVERIAQIVVAALLMAPRLAGGTTVTGVTSGSLDPATVSPNPEPAVTVNLAIIVTTVGTVTAVTT